MKTCVRLENPNRIVMPLCEMMCYGSYKYSHNSTVVLFSAIHVEIGNGWHPSSLGILRSHYDVYPPHSIYLRHSMLSTLSNHVGRSAHFYRTGTHHSAPWHSAEGSFRIELSTRRRRVCVCLGAKIFLQKNLPQKTKSSPPLPKGGSENSKTAGASVTVFGGDPW